MKSDIVYILKNGEISDEIIYSIRSVCKNFPYRKIWIYGLSYPRKAPTSGRK